MTSPSPGQQRATGSGQRQARGRRRPCVARGRSRSSGTAPGAPAARSPRRGRTDHGDPRLGGGEVRDRFRPSALVRSRPAGRARAIGSERSDGLTLTTAAAAGTWPAPPGAPRVRSRSYGWCVASAARNRDPAEADTRSGTGQLDAVVLPWLLAVPIVAGDRHSVALRNREADTQRVRALSLPGRGSTVATGDDNHGRRWRVTVSSGLAHDCGSAGRRVRDRAALGGRAWAGAEPLGTSP
jgi:hypothetical protein